MAGKQRILFVCTGNTCRSPMAAGHLRYMLAAEGKDDNFLIESAGLAAWPGAPASVHGVTVAAGHGIDLRKHRARRLTPEMVAAATLVITMTRGHKEAVLALAPDAVDKVQALVEVGAASPPEDGDIGDPFGHSLEVYRHVWEEIARHLQRILPYLGADVVPPGRGDGPSGEG